MRVHAVVPQQHGFNAVMMLLELALSRVPANFFMSGYMALWISVFNAWSTIYYATTGRCPTFSLASCGLYTHCTPCRKPKAPTSDF